MGTHFKSAWETMSSLFVPTFLRPGAQYSLRDFQADAIAGITVAVIQIPQAMAFALIAGLPAVYGLYASLPGFIASLWGSSRQLSTGPVAIVSLLTFTSLVPFAAPGTPDFIGLAALLAALVGIIYLALGVMRLGFIMNLIPQSVIVGFSSAAAAIIVLTQLPTFLGVTVTSHDLVLQNIFALVRSLPTLAPLTCGVGSIALLLLALFRTLPRAFPGPLIVLILGIAAGYFFHLGESGIDLVAAFPSSVPVLTFPSLSAVPLMSLIPKAAIIALVGFVSAHATAKLYASKTKETLNTDQELVGQGLANIVTGFFQGYPISGSFTRTAVNVEAGARTGMANVVSVTVTLIALLFFAPVFAFLPKTILSAIVILSALPLIDVARLRSMYAISRSDAYIAYLTFAMAFILRPDDAIFIGIVAALLLLVHRTTWGSRAFEMGADREWQVLRGAVEEDRVETFPGICVAHLGVSLYYANIAHLMTEVEHLMRAHEKRENVPVKILVLDVSAVHSVDITALEFLVEYIEKQRERGVQVCFLYLRRVLREALMRFPTLTETTVLHNITELRQLSVSEDDRMLILSGSHPEKIGGVHL